MPTKIEMFNKKLMITIVAIVSISALVGLDVGSSYALNVDVKIPDIKIKNGTIWLPSDLMCIPGTVLGVQNIVINVTGIEYCELYIDGIFVSKIYLCKQKDHISGYYGRWDTTNYANGLHEIRIVGADGEVVDSVIVYVENDDTVVPPTQDEHTLLHPIGDTAISLKATNDSVYGSLSSITTRNRYGSTAHPYYWEHDILIRFDLSSIPVKIPIVSAKLYLYYFSYGDNDPVNRSLTAHLITSDWNENTVTWDTSPSYDPMVSASAIVPSETGRWMSWDFTSDVQKFVNGEKTNFGWQIMDEMSWGTYGIPCTHFYSKENGFFIPYLEIIT